MSTAEKMTQIRMARRQKFLQKDITETESDTEIAMVEFSRADDITEDQGAAKTIFDSKNNSTEQKNL